MQLVQDTYSAGGTQEVAIFMISAVADPRESRIPPESVKSAKGF